MYCETEETTQHCGGNVTSYTLHASKCAQACQSGGVGVSDRSSRTNAAQSLNSDMPLSRWQVQPSQGLVLPVRCQF